MKVSTPPFMCKGSSYLKMGHTVERISFRVYVSGYAEFHTISIIVPPIHIRLTRSMTQIKDLVTVNGLMPF